MCIALLALALSGCQSPADPSGLVRPPPVPDTGLDSETSRPPLTDTGTRPTADTATRDTATPGDTRALHTADTSEVDTGPFFSVEVGTGEFSYVPLAANDPIEIIAGWQGGWHVLGGLRVCNMLAPFDVRYTVTDLPSSTVVSDQFYVQWALIDEGNGCRNTYNLLGFLNVIALAYGDLDTPPELLTGHVLEMKFTVTDALGREETGAVEVVAWSP
jgi:hypothetical protein